MPSFYTLKHIFMLKSLFFAPLFLTIASLSAQPSIQWQITLGGTLYDEPSCIEQTADGGYIAAGTTVSDDGDVETNYGSFDFWVIRLDSLGQVVWKKNYGGSGWEEALAVRQTPDGGFILAGHTESNDLDVSGNHGNKDAWVLKLDGDGIAEWQKCLGGSGRDEASDIQVSKDGGYILAGWSASTDGDVSGNHGSIDCWVVKLSATAVIEWQKSYGGSDVDYAHSVSPTSDGGYIVAGRSQSDDGNVIGGPPGMNAWVLKLNFEGKIEWQHSLGGTGIDRANEIHQTKDGGYIMIGQTGSDDGDVTGHNGGYYDVWVVKLNASGGIEWQQALGGTSEDYGRSICQTSDDGYVLTGLVNSKNGDVTGNHGSSDLWVVKLTPEGDLVWQKAFGGTNAERGHSIEQTTDGGFIIAGDAWSNNGDVSGVQGKTDFWIIKLAPESSASFSPSVLSVEIYPNPAQHTITLQIPSEQPPLHIRISNALGRTVGQQTLINETPINVAELPNGLYWVHATSLSGKIYTGKFLIAR